MSMVDGVALVIDAVDGEQSFSCLVSCSSLAVLRCRPHDADQVRAPQGAGQEPAAHRCDQQGRSALLSIVRLLSSDFQHCAGGPAKQPPRRR